MKKHLFLISILFSLISYSGTAQTTAAENTNQNLEMPTIDFQELESNFLKWWTYQSQNISLSTSFIGMDDSSKKIEKAAFLEALITGNYIPIKLKSTDNLIYYQLFKLSEAADKDIRSTIKMTTGVTYHYFKMEGTQFPEFSFVDVNGKEYNNENTKGKIVLIKCWFIACTACVKEFPELNELVEKYQNDTSIEFISLAFDTKEKLNQFLLKKPFNYAVVPNQRGFMSEVLKVQHYPTHILINKNGLIEKVINKSHELISEFEKLKN